MYLFKRFAIFFRRVYPKTADKVEQKLPWTVVSGDLALSPHTHSNNNNLVFPLQLAEMTALVSHSARTSSTWKATPGPIDMEGILYFEEWY